MFQVAGDHGISRNVVGELVRAVRGAKPRLDHASFVGDLNDSSRQLCAGTIESVVVLPESLLFRIVFALLLQHAQHALQGLQKTQIHEVNFVVASHVLVRKSQERSKGVNLKFPLPNCFRCVFLSSAQIHGDPEDQFFRTIVQIGRTWQGTLEPLKGIGVGVHHDELRLSVDESSREIGHKGALFGHAKVGNELVGRVSQPHGFDVSGYDVNCFLTQREVVVLNRGRESVRKSLVKHVKKGSVLSCLWSTMSGLRLMRQSCTQAMV